MHVVRLLLTVIIMTGSTSLATAQESELSEQPLLRLSVPELDRHAPLGESVAGIVPARDDYAWEGLVVGAAVGLLLSVAVNAAYADLEGHRSLGAALVTTGVMLTVTVPLGALVGGAIRKPAPPKT